MDTFEKQVSIFREKFPISSTYVSPLFFPLNSEKISGSKGVHYLDVLL